MNASEKKPQELYELGLHYLDNSRFDLAIPIFEELAGKMHGLSLYQLGHLYKSSKMKEVLRSFPAGLSGQDWEAKAKAYLRAAAGLGVPGAGYELGSLLERTEGDSEDAAFWLRKAAGDGHIKASSKLAGIYLRWGKLDGAETYLRRAAESGDGQAAYDLAMLYFANRQRPPGFQRKLFSALTEGQQRRIENYKRAFPILVEAANLGCVEAQYRLGLLLWEGLTEFHAEICPRDEVMADTLIKEAARQGHNGAARFLQDPTSDHPRRGLG